MKVESEKNAQAKIAYEYLKNQNIQWRTKNVNELLKPGKQATNFFLLEIE